ncbi:MAG: hypothetical protein IRZ11_06950 [Clostridia bacterium]|nr:hypothetical protein [Clostridia bacterium]
MLIRKFRRPTLTEALEEVRRAFGPDAVVLSTQRGSDGPLWRRSHWVEVVAAPAPGAAPAGGPGRRRRLDRSDVAEDDLVPLRAAVLRRAAPLAQAAREERPAYRPDARLAGPLRAEPWRPPSLRPDGDAPAGGEAGADERPADGVAAFMGPSGAGKTTAAARYALAERRAGRDVAVATAFAYRPGATQHLRALVRPVGLEVDELGSPASLRAWVAAHEGCARVVDFGPANPREPAVWDEWCAWLRTLPADARRILVIPAGWSGEDAELVVAAFAAAGAGEVVLTKCDETAKPEAAEALARRAGLAVAARLHGPSALPAAPALPAGYARPAAGR